MKKIFTFYGMLLLLAIIPFSTTFSQINQNCQFGVEVLDFSSLNGSTNAENDINAAGLSLNGTGITVSNTLNGGATLSDNGVNDDHLNGCIGANFGAANSNGPTENVVTTWTFASPGLSTFCFRILDIDRNDEIIVDAFSNGTVYPLTSADFTIPYTGADGPCISYLGNNIFTSVCTPPIANIGNTLRGAADICIPAAVDQLIITFYDKGTTGGGSYTICQMEVCAGNPLPIELTNFNGTINNCKTDLTWETGSEQGFSHFLLQKSVDGETFSTIERIDGAGAENTPTRYSYIDQDQLVKHNYYRLALVDGNESISYSKVIEVTAECADGVYLSDIFPNPVKGVSKIRVNNSFEGANATVVITDVSGKKVRQYPVELVSGTNEIELDAIGISAGIYYVNLESQNWRSVHRKFVVH